MGRSRLKRLLSAFLCVCMVAMMAPAAFAAEGETTTVSTNEALASAVANAKSGDTITLAAGTFDLETVNVAQGKSLTFVGAGKNDTIVQYGKAATGGSDGGGGSYYGFDGAGAIAFENVTLQDKIATKDYFRGFVRAASMSFTNCKFTNVAGYWGNGAVTFKNCEFTTEVAESFNVKCYSGTSFDFDGCTFSSPYGFIDAYRQNTLDGSLTVKVNNCTFTGTGSTEASKPAVRLCDYTNAAEGGAWDVYFTGTNTVTNVKVDEKTGTNLYGCRFYDSNTPILGTVYVDGKKVFSKGAPAVDVAEVNGVKYTSLADAVAAAKDGGTIELLKDYTGNLWLTKGEDVTFNLNGHTLSNTNYPVYVKHGKLAVNGPGVIKENTPDFGAIFIKGSTEQSDTDYTSVTVNKNVTLEGWAPVFIDQNSAKAYGVSVNLNGVILNAKDDTSGAVGAGIYANGQITDEVNAPVINLDATTITSTGHGMYLAGYADTTVNDGNVAGDQTGIEIRAGKLTVNGAAVTGNGTPTSVTPNGNGSTADGAGIAVMQHTTRLPIDVTISDGTISGYTALLQSNPQNNPADSIAKVNINVTGGKFAAINGGANAVSSDNKRITISGGLFNTKFDKSYCVAPLTVVPSGNTTYPWTVGEAGDNPADVAAGAPTVKQPDISYVEGSGEKTLLDSAQTALTTSTPEVAGTGIDTAASVVANKNTVTANDEVVAKLYEKDTTATTDNTNIVIQTYMDMKITGVDATANKQSISVDIQPMYRTVATTADVNNGGEIVLEASGTQTVNAVQIGQPQKLDVQAGYPVEVKIPVPDNFVTDATHLVVKHEKNGKLVGYHDATYNDTDNTITFTNDKGFSTFTVLSDARSTTIQFKDKDGNNIASAAYGPSNVNDALPTTAAESGYVFNGWKFEGIDGVYTTLTDDLLTKLAAKSGTVSATPDFSKRSSSSSSGGSTSNTFKVTTSAVNNGGVNASPSSAAKGATITITLSPDKGYKLDKLTVTDGSGKTISTTKKSDTVYTFTMPASAVKVSVSYVKDDSAVVKPTTGFSDVAATAWYANAVKYAVDKGMMNGVGGNKFAPDGVTNRGMIVTVLYRLENEPTASAASFTDVASGAYYANAVAWASANGIVTGYGNGKFGPNDSITREQFAAILYRYAQYKKYDVSAAASLDGYTDAQSVSSYAVPAVQWACGAGVMNGSNGRLTPKSGATRAQAAQLLMNFCEKTAK